MSFFYDLNKTLNSIREKSEPTQLTERVAAKGEMTPKQQSFAGLAPPRDKITFADKIAGAKKGTQKGMSEATPVDKKRSTSSGGEETTTKTGVVHRAGQRYGGGEEEEETEVSDTPRGKGRPKGPNKGPERVTGKAWKHKGERAGTPAGSSKSATDAGKTLQGILIGKKPSKPIGKVSVKHSIKEQGMAEVTGDKPFDAMMGNIIKGANEKSKDSKFEQVYAAVERKLLKDVVHSYPDEDIIEALQSLNITATDTLVSDIEAALYERDSKALRFYDDDEMEFEESQQGMADDDDEDDAYDLDDPKHPTWAERQREKYDNDRDRRREELDELSPATINSYSAKAKGQASWAGGVAKSLGNRPREDPRYQGTTWTDPNVDYGPQGNKYAKLNQKRGDGIEAAAKRGATASAQSYDFMRQGGYGDKTNPAIKPPRLPGAAVNEIVDENDKAGAYCSHCGAKKSQKPVAERSVSKAQVRTMGAAAHNPKFAKKVGIKPGVAKEFNKADKGKDNSKLPEKAAKKADAPKKVKESDSGTPAPKSTGGISYGKGIYDSLNRDLEKLITESMNINLSMDTAGSKSLTVTATDEDAMTLGALLKSAGIGSDLHSRDAASQMHAEMGNETCPSCGQQDCCCEAVDEAYGDTSATSNSMDYPTETVSAEDNFEYAGGLNRPKSTGQSTVPVLDSQDERQITYEADLQRMRDIAGITEAQSAAQKAAFSKMIAAKGGKEDPSDKTQKETEKMSKDDKKVEESIFDLTNQWKAYKG